MTDTPEPVVDDPAGDIDEQLDTNDGERDPLTTEDGLNAVAETMPEVTSHDGEVIGEDAQPPELRPRLDEPELDVGDDGNDPLAGLAGCDEEG